MPDFNNKMDQNRNWLGLRPRPHWRSSRRSPDPLVWWGGGHSLPILHPLCASTLAPSALDLCAVKNCPSFKPCPILEYSCIRHFLYHPLQNPAHARDSTTRRNARTSSPSRSSSSSTVRGFARRGWCLVLAGRPRLEVASSVPSSGSVSTSDKRNTPTWFLCTPWHSPDSSTSST